jgi:CHAD domain-containing protein
MGKSATTVRLRRSEQLRDVIGIFGHVRALAVVDAEAIEDPVERIHQQRVAIRRLRSLIRLVGPVVQTQQAGVLDEDLAWVASSLGDRRDLDVMSNLVRRDAEFCANEDALDLRRCLESELDRRRVIADAELRRCISSKRYRILKRSLSDLDLTSWFGDQASVADLTPKLMRRQWHRLSRAQVELDSKQDYQSWHRMRMRAKNLRYSLEPFAPMYPGVDRCSRRLGELTDLMGRVCDVHNEQELVTFTATCSDVTVAFQAGRRVAQLELRQIQLEEGLPECWARVRRAWTALGFQK